MGLEHVKDDIINDAKKQAEGIIAEANRQADELKAKADAEVSSMDEGISQSVDKAVDAEKTKEVAKASFAAKKLVHDAKQKSLDAAYEKASEKMAGYDASRRKEIISSLLAKAKKGMDVATVYANKHDKALISGFTAKEAPISGGIIAENKDGTERLDYSYEALLSQIKERNVAELANILFGKN